MNMPRQAQIIYPKDTGIILQWADIHPGSRVVEIGTGFGALTMAIARAIGEKGLLISYEMREDVARKALKNIEKYIGKAENVIIKNSDASDGIEEEGVDCIITDIPQPWLIVEHLEKALRPGGILLNFLPTIIQAREITEALRKRKTFAMIETIETLLRPWNIEGMSVRPVHKMQAHTGFITTSRRLKGGYS
jgi:tRNA (adenine57-N1/adenine58-N1)-methyltransferase